MINKEQAREMRRLGFTIVEIARRLGCGMDNIKRICKGVEVENPAWAKFRDALRRDEVALWRTAYILQGSYSKVAYMYGRSRQAVYEALNPEAGAKL